MTSLNYKYCALDQSGARQHGTLRAATTQEACRTLLSKGLTPVEVVASRERRLGRRAGLSDASVAHLTYQLSVLLSARIPITEGLAGIAEQERDPVLGAVVSAIASKIGAGEPLSAALAEHPGSFGTVYVETVKAAERSGNLVAVLDQLAEMLERQAETRRLVKSAFMYPACVLAVLVAGVTFLIGFVIPKFAATFESRGADLPLLTEILMVIGQAMQAYWWAIGPAAIGASAAGWMWVRTPRGREGLAALGAMVPVMGELLQGLAIARFARVLGLTIGSGLPLVECLQLAGRSAGNPGAQRDAGLLAEQVRRGGRLSAAMRSCASLTPFARRMLSAGEEAAELPRMCQIVSRHYEREAAHLTKALGSLIEPVLIVLIALVVLVVALAVFLPMWDMVNLVR